MKAKKIHPEWCPLYQITDMQTPDTYYRCPHCNKRLKVLAYDCEDMHREKNKPTVSHLKKNGKKSGQCIHYYIPEHKNKKNR